MGLSVSNVREIRVKNELGAERTRSRRIAPDDLFSFRCFSTKSGVSRAVFSTSAVEPRQRGGHGRGQQNGGRGDGQRRTAGRAGQRLRGRFHAAVKPAVVQLGDGAVLRPSALQIAIPGLVPSHRVGLDVPANTRFDRYLFFLFRPDFS